MKRTVLLVRILVEVVDAVGVEERRAALDAVHLVALVEQELGEVGAVLAGDAGDQCDLGHPCQLFSVEVVVARPYWSSKRWMSSSPT